MLSKYQLKWTIVFFEHKLCDPKEWRKFKLKYERKFHCRNGKIHENCYAMWALEKERIDWIKNNIPNVCSIHIIQITDKQFGDAEWFYKR